MVARRPIRPFLACAAVAWSATLTAGCTGGASSSSATSQGGSVTAAATSTGATSAASAAAPSSPAAAAPTSTSAVHPVMVLEPDGLGFLVGDASIRHLRFGEADATAVTSALTAALGGPLTVDNLPECGQGPRKGLRRAGFSALLDGTKFVGWTDQGAAGRHLTTVNGIGIGSTLGQVTAAMTGVTTSNDSLRPEFISAGGFGGTLTGLATGSTVKLTYAGETCFFR